jgi:hypothetical protein
VNETAAPEVFGLCNRLEVFRVNAAPNAAFVIKLQTLGDRSNVALVGKSMRQDFRIRGPIEQAIAI